MIGEERRIALAELLMLVQEKDEQGDKVAVEVLIWAHQRLVNSPNNVID